MTRTMKILVVDDEPDVAGYLARVLKGAGHEVSIARDGSEALEALSGESFDMVFSDWRMPVVSGTELLREIQHRWPSLLERFSFISGNLYEEELSGLVEETGVSVLHKPFKADQVTELVQRLSQSVTAQEG